MKLRMILQQKPEKDKKTFLLHGLLLNKYKNLKSNVIRFNLAKYKV